MFCLLSSSRAAMVWLPLLIVSAATETTCLLQGSKVTEPREELFEKPREESCLNQVLVVPELKLVFTYIPKNSCTAFADLVDAINGIPPMGRGFRTISSASAKGWTRHDLTDAFNDPTWMFATFVRDPVERLVSAYLDKCVDDVTQKHCALPGENITLDEIVFSGVLEGIKNDHWWPQSTVFEALGTPVDHYDYVGVVSKDRSEVGRQVHTMLELAIERGNVSKHRAEEILGFGDVGFPQEQPTEEEPEEGASNREMHNFGHTGTITEDYITPDGIAKAEEIYKVDYDHFVKWLTA